MSKSLESNQGTSREPSGKLSKRERILYSMAGLCIVSANAAVYIGLFMPPKGEVDSSILGYFGLVCAFAGALFGITADFRSSMMKLN